MPAVNKKACCWKMLAHCNFLILSLNKTTVRFPKFELPSIEISKIRYELIVAVARPVETSCTRSSCFASRKLFQPLYIKVRIIGSGHQ